MIRVWAILATVLFGAVAQAQATVSLAEQEEAAIRRAADKAAPSLVRIETIGAKENAAGEFGDVSASTGVVVAADGWIVASAFLFVGEPSAVIVVAPDGRRLGAKLAARDRGRGLALLKVDVGDKPLAPAIPATVADVRPGQTAVALGRTLDEGKIHLSVGVVGALGRVWDRAIQTDAKISPANFGGALVDLRGRTIGVLTPLSPYEDGDLAGAEWYDSGIGFAVPLADILARLERWKSGDLLPGILGVTVKRGDMYVLPAKIAVCRPDGPAFAAGVRSGDRIVEIDGKPIATQSQMKHALGAKIAGEATALVVQRGQERVSASVVLADRLKPWRHPYLGVLPSRLKTDGGVKLLQVAKETPAAKAGLQAGDVLTKIGERAIATTIAADEALANSPPGGETSIAWTRDGQAMTATVSLGELAAPTGFDGPLAEENPPVDPAPLANEAPKGLVPMKLEEAPNACVAFVPSTFREDRPHGLVVWTSAGDVTDDKLEALWKTHCERHRFVLLVPRPAAGRDWQRSELGTIQALTLQSVRQFKTDRRRIVSLGEGTGGLLAWGLAFTQRDLFRGVAAFDAPFPPRAPTDNEPLQRMDVFVRGSKSPFAPLIEAGVKRLRDAKFPVDAGERAGQTDGLTTKELDAFVQWYGAIDRL